MGAAAGNPLVTILSRALIVGVVCYVVGAVVGHVASGVIAREVEHHVNRFPIPETPGGAVEPEPEPPAA